MFSGLPTIYYVTKGGVDGVGSNVLEIPVGNVVIMQVLHAGQYGFQNRDSISLGKATALADTLKEFSTNCELESEIVR